MTVIAWDGRFVAADSMGTAGSTRCLVKQEKLRWHEDVLFGFSGSIPLFEPMICWYLAGACPDVVPKGSHDQDESTLFVFHSNGAGFFYKTSLPYPERVFPPDAWGAAADHVIGGLDAGLSAGEAIENALKREIWIGGPVQVVDLKVNAEVAEKRSQYGIATVNDCDHEWLRQTAGTDPSVAYYCLKCGVSLRECA